MNARPSDDGDDHPADTLQHNLIRDQCGGHTQDGHGAQNEDDGEAGDE